MVLQMNALPGEVDVEHPARKHLTRIITVNMSMIMYDQSMNCTNVDDLK